MISKALYWDDTACGQYFPFICEIPLSRCSPLACPIGAGKILDNLSCGSCISGKYSNLETNSFCVDCPLHQESTESRTSCFECTVGTFYDNSSRSCSSCPQGTFSNVSSQTFCFNCPQGYGTAVVGSSSISFCIACDPGYGLTSMGCAVCPPGKFSPKTQAYCDDCPPGKFSTSIASTMCVDCPEGNYGKLNGQTGCLACEPGQWVDIQGSSECFPCEAGKYNVYSGMSSNAFCTPCPFGSFNPNMSAAQCLNCPNNSKPCVEGTSVPIIPQGFWSNSNELFACSPSEACPQQDYIAGKVSTCTFGYTGQLCADCSGNFFRVLGSCRKCLNTYLRISLIIISCFLVLLLVKAALQRIQLPANVKVTLFWFQLLGIYPMLFDSWPPALASLFDLSGFLNLEIGYFGIGCDFKNSYFLVVVLKLSLPLIAWALLNILDLLRQRKQDFRILVLKNTSHVLLMANFLSLQLLSTMFQIFKCSRTKSLVMDPSISCFSSDWKIYVAVNSLFILVYLLFIPTVTWVLYCKCSKNVQHPEFSSLYGQLFKSYRKGCEGFECFKLLFKLMLVVIRDLLSVSNIGKSTLYMCLFVWQIWIESFYRPYESSESNDLSLLWNVTCILILISQFVFSSAEVSSQIKVTFVVLFFLLVSSIVSYVVIKEVISIVKQSHEQPHTVITTNREDEGKPRPF
eukprot:TRINITY_DN14290_c0_g1_i6.p1 TRINITY_DN14290_c0_g1~~TRINITY_DN14290_c0_g1_i6.p1  ORF type:complete len:685 (-),score=96.30 TRINITY_DN14290_c0_g1_i6:96-2150(-)